MCIKEEKNSRSSLSPSFPVNRFKAQCRAGAAKRRARQLSRWGEGKRKSVARQGSWCVLSDFRHFIFAGCFCFLFFYNIKKEDFYHQHPLQASLCCSPLQAPLQASLPSSVVPIPHFSSFVSDFPSPILSSVPMPHGPFLLSWYLLVLQVIDSRLKI